MCVKPGHLRPPDGEPAAAGLIDKLPCAMAWRVLESGAAGAISRLGCLAVFVDRGPPPSDFPWLACASLQDRSRENHIVRRTTVPIRKAHLPIAERAQIALPANAARFEQKFFRLPA